MPLRTTRGTVKQPAIRLNTWLPVQVAAGLAARGSPALCCVAGCARGDAQDSGWLVWVSVRRDSQGSVWVPVRVGA